MMRKPVNFGRSKQYPGQMTFTPVATKSQKPRQMTESQDMPKSQDRHI
jgi:hypothetical protein